MITAPILVQKYGGTSVATAERRRSVIEHVRTARADGFSVAVVVSAMGRRGDPYSTDTLLGLLRSEGGVVDPREYDLIFTSGEAISAAVLAHALRQAGIPAIGMTSVQAGIFTDGRHQEADIVVIDAARLIGTMSNGDVPVITGAQGVAPGTMEYTTLGRGGSDTSGVALGAALHARRVEIFTDVPGVATVDPRLVPGARILHQIDYNSMLELARFGASVLHPRAVAAAQGCGLPIVVRSTFSDDPGTLIGDVEDEAPICGIAVLTAMRTTLASAGGIDPSMRESWERDGVMSLNDASSNALLVGGRTDAADALEIACRAVSAEGRRELGDCCWITAVGCTAGLATVASDARSILGEAGIEIWGAETVERRMTFVLPESARERAVQLLYRHLFSS